jgi:hypothetical protein
LSALDRALAEVETADAHLRQVTYEARQRLKAAVAALGPSIRSLAADEREPAERDALARRLYWGYLRVPVREIVVALGFTGQADLLDAVGTFDTGVPCDDCGRPLLASTRTQLNAIRPESRRPSYARHGVSCPACLQIQRTAEAARWALAERRRRLERPGVDPAIETDLDAGPAPDPDPAPDSALGPDIGAQRLRLVGAARPADGRDDRS